MELGLVLIFLPFFESCNFTIQCDQVDQYGNQYDEADRCYDIDFADTPHKIRSGIALRQSGLMYANEYGKEPYRSQPHEGLK